MYDNYTRIYKSDTFMIRYPRKIILAHSFNHHQVSRQHTLICVLRMLQYDTNIRLCRFGVKNVPNDMIGYDGIGWNKLDEGRS